MEDKKVLTEVYEILQHLSNENFNKIPSNVINLIKENMDKSYIWKYDNTKSLTEQNISRDTVAVLSYINMEYLLNVEQKELIEKLHNRNEEDLDRIKKEEYNSENLFKRIKTNTSNTNQNKALVDYSKVKWYKRFLTKILHILKRNN